jgi:hypothetical protein
LVIPKPNKIKNKEMEEIKMLEKELEELELETGANSVSN